MLGHPRKFEPGQLPEFIAFDSDQGRELIEELKKEGWKYVL